MKKLTTLICSILLFQGLANAQQVNAEYLNPNVTGNTNYKYLKIGTASEYFAGFMNNYSSTDYGNGNDFSIFTYSNRDLTFRTGTGNVIFFPSLGGSIGIGTKTPGTYKLTLQQSTSQTGRGFRIINAEGTKSAQMWVGSGGAVLDAEGTSNLHLRSNGADRLYIKNDGLIGIGTTNPVSSLHIKHRSSNYNPGALLMESSNGSSVYGLINSNNNFYIGYNSNNGAGFPLSSFSGRFFIKSNGNVGIGTNEPAEKLHVNGRMYL